MAMTPANDAFTLNTRYSYTHSPRRSSTRSPSPTTTALGKLTRRNTSNPRRLSHGANGTTTSTTTQLQDIGEDVTREADVGRRSRSPEVKKIDWEIPRKLLHSSIGFFVVPLYTRGIVARPVIIVLSGALAVISAADLARFTVGPFERLYERFFGFLMRASEKHKVNGVIWYLIGVLISLKAYPLDVAVVSILILSWADTAASTFGRLWGPRTPPLPARVPLLPFLPRSARARSLIALPFAPRKSLAGFLAASLTAGLIAFGFWGWVAPLCASSTAVWTWDDEIVGGWLGLGVLSLVSAVIGGVAEALDVGSLDDNLTIPVLTGGGIWGFLRLVSALFQ
ncbi:hypothetical protein M422DRAFT_783113 [Sphaerobolus stellatus SS14]|uniref:Dolichol kinase n=1 Tax=Sphaerobolus stellatus (strain SS14) TaxID=990650 RepID=A0A0C9UW98_SPHS4|nr:hypothetical protein M422DRAFT_783113 [Sphaerobolus stellatus SS14]